MAERYTSNKKYKEMSNLERYRSFGIISSELQNRIANSMDAIEEKGASFALRDAYNKEQASSNSIIATDDNKLKIIIDKLMNNVELTEEEETIMYSNVEEIDRLLSEE